VTLVQVQRRLVASVQAARVRKAMTILRKAARAPGFNDADDLLSVWHSCHAPPVIGAVSAPRAQLSMLALSVQLDSFP